MREQARNLVSAQAADAAARGDAELLHERGRADYAIARHLRLKQWARLERFPLALALPWGVAVGPWLPWLPLPFPIRLRFLSPRIVPADAEPNAVRDGLRAEMQSALDDMARAARERRP